MIDSITGELADNTRDLDQTYVETTNKRVADMLAAQEGAEFVVHSREVNGRTMYRVRPRIRSSSSTSSKPAASGSAGPSISVTPAAVQKSASKRSSSLRPSRSIPLLRVKPELNTAGTKQNESSHLQARSRTLRRFGSSPLLGTNVASKRQPEAGGGHDLGPSSFHQGDVLGRLLGWNETPTVDLSANTATDPEGEMTPRKTSRGQHSNSSDPSTTPPVRPSHSRSQSSPFGAGVRMPISLQQQKSSARLATFSQYPQHAMREVSSSDSIRTAKADDHRTYLPRRPRFQDTHVFDIMQGLEMRTREDAPFSEERNRLPSVASVSSSLSDLSRTTAQQITVATAPDDDPRFVIWGYRHRSTSVSLQEHESAIRLSAEMDLSPPASASGSPATTYSKRWSLRDRSSPATSLRESLGSVSEARPPRRVLMAATIERLVAELTSKISSELLTNFFLTFRSFMRSLDLLHLLTTRFDWAMQPASSLEDDAGRRIVRVRTFVVLRHWLLNHFMDDFFYDRTLRTTLCDWLNLSARKLAFRESPKDQRLIKGLKKLVRKLKETHVAIKPEQLEAARLAADTSPLLGDDDVDLEVDYAGRARNGAAFFRRTSLGEDGNETLKRPPLSAGSFTISETPNTIARSLNAAVSKMSRFKLKLGSRTSRYGGQDGQGQTMQVDRNEGGDLLWIEGGIEQYISSMGIKRASEQSSTIDSEEKHEQNAPAIETSCTTNVVIPEVDEPMDEITSSTGLQESLEVKPTTENELRRPAFLQPPAPVIPIFEPELDLYDSSEPYKMRPDSVRIELDDIDLSDEDEDVTEVKRTLKRLPGAANLRLGDGAAPARCSSGTVSSMDAIRAPSYAGPDRDTVLYADEETGYEGQQGMQVVAGFILDGLVDSDDDEPGDVEAALRRLEGIVDDSKQKERAIKVERQMERSAAILNRQAAGGNDRESHASGATTDADSSLASIPASPASVLEPVPISVDLDAVRPEAKKSAATTLLTPTARKPAMAHKPSISNLFGALSGRDKSDKSSSGFVGLVYKSPSPPTHRSFVLFARSEVLARQFCLIERDLLLAVNWRDLVNEQRHGQGRTLTVLDWETYIKDRRRAKAEGINSSDAVKYSSIDAIVARFNLTSNWVCSEIVLTANLDERAVLVAKFIRLAFKCYCQSNFQTMAQIVHGLQLPDVERLKKTWAKVPSWEIRKYRGMQTFVSPNRNFKHLRDVINAVIAEYGMMSPQTATTSTASFSKASKTQVLLGCIPFFGLFLRDLAVNQELSTFLDPTYTGAPADVNAAGELVSVRNLNAFEHLSPLSYNMPLRPLVNVHKFRLQATVVQRVLAAQELASGYPFQPDTTRYLRTLKIRSLDSHLLHEVSKKLEP